MAGERWFRNPPGPSGLSRLGSLSSPSFFGREVYLYLNLHSASLAGSTAAEHLSLPLSSPYGRHKFSYFFIYGAASGAKPWNAEWHSNRLNIDCPRRTQWPRKAMPNMPLPFAPESQHPHRPRSLSRGACRRTWRSSATVATTATRAGNH